MNKHTKLAIFVFPFLILGGYIASGYYLEFQANKNKVFELHPKGFCNVLMQKCILESGDFQINVYDVDGLTQVNSTFPLDKVTLFLIDDEGQVKGYQMAMADNPYYWQIETELRDLLTRNKNGQDHYILRLIADIKGGKYISEFSTASL